MKLPVKTRILEIIAQKGEAWEEEIITKILEEYGRDFSPLSIGRVRYSLAELYAGGLIKQIDIKEDSEQRFVKEGKLLHQYSITDFGVRRANEADLNLEG